MTGVRACGTLSLKEMGSYCRILSRRLAWSDLYFKRVPLPVVIEADVRGAKVKAERDLLRGCSYPSRWYWWLTWW